MRIAVLGATGMIGNHTTRAALARGHEVLVVHRASSSLKHLQGLPIRTAQAALEDRTALCAALESVEAVIHCAGYYPAPIPGEWQQEIDTASRQLGLFFDACDKGTLRKIVFVGSVVALPREPRGEPATEALEFTGPPKDRTPYLQLKVELDRLARQKAKEGFPVVLGIPGMCLGEYDKGPTTGRLIVEILKQQLPGYVKGRRNVIYAGDAGRGMVLAAESGRIGERYLFTGTNVTLDELVGRIAALGKVRRPRWGIPPGLARVLARAMELRYRLVGGAAPKLTSTAIAVSSGQFLDGKKAKAELGYQPEVDLDDAILRAIRWFEAEGYLDLTTG